MDSEEAVPPEGTPSPTAVIGEAHLHRGDSFDVLDDFAPGTVDAVVTDPPYNYDDGFLQESWDNIGSGDEYREWCREWAERCRHALTDDGVLIAFSSNRTHHQLFAGIDDAGFEIRSTVCWFYGGGMPKSARLKTWIDDPEAAERWGDWRGMLKPAVEYAVYAVPEGAERDEPLIPYELPGTTELPPILLDPSMGETTSLDSAMTEGFHTPIRGTARFVYEPKASVTEKTHNGEVENDHATVKPISLMETLVEAATDSADVVLDPFAGTATTAIAALNTGRIPVCIERDVDFFDTACDRLRSVTDAETKTATLDMFASDGGPTPGKVQVTPYPTNREQPKNVDLPPVEGLADREAESVHAVIGTPVPPRTFSGDVCPPVSYRQWCQSWATDALDVLKPGGHVVAFGGDATHHHLGVALDDAGFEIRDVIAWIFGVVRNSHVELRGEYIVLARRPCEGSAVANQLEHGVGNLNIEACRIASKNDSSDVGIDANSIDVDAGVDGSGRYPANAVFDRVAARVLDSQSGTSVSSGGRAYQNTNDMYSGGWAEEDGVAEDPGYGDEGGASRYFVTTRGPDDTLEPRIGRDELLVKPDGVYRWFKRLVTADGQVVVHPFADP